MDKRKELYAYLRPSRLIYIPGAIFLLITIIGAPGSANPLGLIAIGLIFAGLGFIPTGIRELQLMEALKEEETNNNLDALYQDFVTGVMIGNNLGRVGKKYTFGKRTGGYYEIQDFTRVYQYIHKTNFIEDKRTVRAQLREGGTVDLFQIGLKGSGDGELMKAIMIIKAINPSVTLGYK